MSKQAAAREAKAQNKTPAKAGKVGAAVGGARGGHGRAAAAREPLADHVTLFEAARNFLQANSGVESSQLIDAAAEELGRGLSLDEVFSAGIKARLFSMSAAMNWAMFLRTAPAQAAEDDGGAPFSAGAPFSLDAAFTLIEQVYDHGMQEVVWDHFEFDDEDDEDEDEGDEEDDENGEAPEGRGGAEPHARV